MIKRRGRALAAAILSIVASLSAGVVVGYGSVAGAREISPLGVTCEACEGSFCSRVLGDGTGCLRACTPFCHCVPMGPRPPGGCSPFPIPRPSPF
jgi:hypothetical protein